MTTNQYKFLMAMMAVVSAFCIVYIFFIVFPFYTNQSPATVEQIVYHPGDCALITFNRHSWINAPARATRELVRVDSDGSEYEVEKVSWDIVIGKGQKRVTVCYDLPEHNKLMHDNTYKFYSMAKYKPWPLFERQMGFETETFQVVSK